MMMDTLWRSLQLVVKHPKLFVPDVVYILISYALFVALYFYSGVNDIYGVLQANAEDIALEQLLIDKIVERLPEVLASVALFITVTFVLGVGIALLRYSLVEQVLKGKKSLSLLHAWNEKVRFFFPVVFLRILLFFLGVGVILVLLMLAFLAYLLVNPFLSQALALSIAVAAAIPLTIVVLILLKLGFLFRYPVMFLEQVKNPVQVLKKSLVFFRKRPFFVVLTWAVIFVIGLIPGIILSSSGYGVDIMLTFLQSVTVLAILTSVWAVFSLLFRLIFEIFGIMFLFLRYKEKD